MSKKLLFIGMVLILMASFTAVLADQNGSDRWCNSDQYGCWVTDEDGGKSYIMFWSETARLYIMGPGSNATVCDPLPGGRMTLEPVTVEKKHGLNLLNSILQDITFQDSEGRPSQEASISNDVY